MDKTAGIDRIDALRRAALFGELDEATLGALAARAVVRRFDRDQLLFIAGEEARGLFVVVAGSVRAFRESADGREQVIHVERAGATVAEVPVFDDGPYPSTVAADEEGTIVLFIDKRDVRRLALAHPEIGLAALKVLAGRLRRCAELVETLSLREVGQRLARFLLSEARSKGTREGGALRVRLAQTNQQIAARVGSVREVVSRAMTRLQHDGLVRLEGRDLTVPDERALAAFAGEE
ncbi:MAG TPA: Crp/Fnr family transcriptional regulator [Pyrinomonadaceae bacterium]|nr:Crp/Fnr family transcriptional regulator [Pyrinomonadaceae bacterium]